jgi:purine nucleoside phosphorylase
MARIGIITGSGTYALPGFQPTHPDPARPVETRFGTTFVSEGTFAGVEVVHVSRHLVGHQRLSNHVAHQANVTALRAAGADGVLAVTVCGAVDPEVPLGSLVVFDDLHFLVNRLPDGRLCTLHDTPGEAGRGHWIHHEAPFAQPLRAALLAGAERAGHPARDGGVYGHVDGPRFNTRAEIRSLALAGVTAVSQTGGPETVLAAEAELPYALVGYATDHANGVMPEPTPVEELGRLIGASGPTFAETLTAAVPLAAAAADAGELAPVGTHFRFG